MTRIRNASVLAGLLLGALLAMGIPTSASAESVLQVVAVEVAPGKLDAYLAKVKQLQAVMTRLGSAGTLQVWQATLAGDNTGTVVVGIEHESLAAFADSTAKVSADPEWQSLVSGLDGIRTLLSSSLYRELTP